jgi:hypothetical protein
VRKRGLGSVTANPLDAAQLEEGGAERVRVVLVDDHDLFRAGLRNLLEEHGVAVMARQAMAMTRFGLLANLHPRSSSWMWICSDQLAAKGDTELLGPVVH